MTGSECRSRLKETTLLLSKRSNYSLRRREVRSSGGMTACHNRDLHACMLGILALSKRRNHHHLMAWWRGFGYRLADQSTAYFVWRTMNVLLRVPIEGRAGILPRDAWRKELADLSSDLRCSHVRMLIAALAQSGARIVVASIAGQQLLTLNPSCRMHAAWLHQTSTFSPVQSSLIELMSGPFGMCGTE